MSNSNGNSNSNTLPSKNNNNPNCPACVAARVHTDAERKEFHPLAGHGVQDWGVSGSAANWTVQGLKELSQSEREEAKATVGGMGMVWDGFEGILGLTCREFWTPIAFRDVQRIVSLDGKGTIDQADVVSIEVAWLCSKCNRVHQIFPRTIGNATVPQ